MFVIDNNVRIIPYGLLICFCSDILIVKEFRTGFSNFFFYINLRNVQCLAIFCVYIKYNVQHHGESFKYSVEFIFQV